MSGRSRLLHEPTMYGTLLAMTDVDHKSKLDESVVFGSVFAFVVAIDSRRDAHQHSDIVESVT
jgi:hypothetical protein